MKGHPLLRALLVAILLGALFLPVWRITHPVHPSTSAPVEKGTLASREPSREPARDALPATILLRGAPEPVSCTVSQAGRVVLSDRNRTAPGKFRTETDLTPGTDLLVSATWSDGNPHAIHLEVLPRDGEPSQRDYWAGATLEDAFPMPEHDLKKSVQDPAKADEGHPRP